MILQVFFERALRSRPRGNPMIAEDADNGVFDGHERLDVNVVSQVPRLRASAPNAISFAFLSG